ncbi:CU044_5270 family protein [Streptomyces yaizuensis]|uniref:CU044_5270 family protein n=1 Tax=Streptomyces yaizuensis TaxID=2989713 RepID=A0ABQ5P7W2_9ACTN|nr:CU044_5270 family protein [Streptomyces sp. YSPA8]GLF98316.1 CU044_5270 family protein [Streptomyces sp. YSPA8]
MERERDVLRRLAAARPAHLDGNGPVPPEVRNRELTGAMLDGLHTIARPAHAVPDRAGLTRPLTPRWRRPGWGVGLAAAVVAASVIAVTVPPWDSGPGAPATGLSIGTDGTAREFLLGAAAKVEHRQDGRGDYWHQRQERGAVHRVPGKDGKPGYDINDRSVDHVWMERDSGDRWRLSDNIGARPATPGDRAAWLAAGSPKSWEAPHGVITYQGWGLTHQDAPGGPANHISLRELEPSVLKTLPTDTAELRERLGDGAGANERLFRVSRAVELAAGAPVGPELRAAAYRVLAEEPGVRTLGSVRDRSGREGHGIAIPFERGEGEQRLVFDRNSGAILGTLNVAGTRPYGDFEEGDVTSYVTVLGNSWTDTEPPFDKDRLGLGFTPAGRDRVPVPVPSVELEPDGSGTP